jgi:enoyl-CoA hydratase/carnithine racemase
MAAMVDEIRTEVEDGICTITLDRPDRMNAFTVTMCEQLLAAFDRTDADDDVRVVVVTGEGRAFCAGADLGAGTATFDYDATAADDPAAEARMERNAEGVPRDHGGLVALRVFESRKPVIAAYNGAAVGVGATMLLPADVRLASTTARFGFVFARRGLVNEAASSWFLPRVVGINRALEWSMTGRVFDAEEALAAGLVRSLHEPDDLLPAARMLAAEIASSTSAVAVTVIRQMLWRMLGADHPMEAHRLDSRAIHALGAMDDVREGVASFLEKRPPRFTLRPSRDLPAFYPWWEDPPFS